MINFTSFVPVVDAVCAAPPSPLGMSGYYVQLLRAHFGDPTHLADPAYRDYFWADSPDGTKTMISIDDVSVWKPERANARPAIVSQRNDWTYSELGMANGELQGYDFGSDGASHHAALVEGSHTIVVIADESAEAENLGWEVFQLLSATARQMRQSLGLIKVTTLGMSKPTKVQEASGGYSVAISQAYTFELGWTLRPDSPLLLKVMQASLHPITTLLPDGSQESSSSLGV